MLRVWLGWAAIKKPLVTLAEGSRRHKEVGRRRVSPWDDESRSKETSESSELGQPSAFWIVRWSAVPFLFVSFLCSFLWDWKNVTLVIMLRTLHVLLHSYLVTVLFLLFKALPITVGLLVYLLRKIDHRLNHMLLFWAVFIQIFYLQNGHIRSEPSALNILRFVLKTSVFSAVFPCLEFFICLS